MKITKLALAVVLPGVLLVGTAMAQVQTAPALSQPTSVRQAAFEYDNYLYFSAPENQASESPSDRPVAPLPSAATPAAATPAAATPAAATPAAAAPVADAGYSETCCSSSCSSFCSSRCEPLWTVHAGAIFLHQSTPGNAVLVTDQFAPGGNVLLNASEFNFDYETGWEIGVTRYLNPCWDLEARYFSVDGWFASRGPVLSPNGSVGRYITPIGNTEFPAIVSGTYESELENVELNARRKVNPRLDILFGFRYVKLEEGGLTVLHDIGPGLNLATHAIDATNHLYGFQLGADATMFSRGRLDIEGVIKAGVYGNNAGNSVTITQPGGQSFASAANANHTAFVGELGLTGVYQVTDSLSLRAGYQLLWIEGVALASDQVAVSDPANGTATVDFNGSPFYDGAFIQLQFTR